MSLAKELTDIKRYISLKKDTRAGDIVLVGTPDGIFYAVVHDIRPDIKKDWYAVRFTALLLPPVDLIWKLRLPQMCGEIFTMNGEEYFMTAVALQALTAENRVCACEDSPGQTGKIIQLAPRTKNP